ncbi:hypothetical protein ACRTDU_05455 [Sunxiuqinia elliptica]
MRVSPVIPKIDKKKADAGNYYWLRSEGLNYIQELSGRIWTDYNTHDPGVTILETLCFALTDLDYRTNFPIADLLAEEKDNEQAMHKQFLSAIRALPSRPVSIADYRRLLIDIPGVRNAWLGEGKQEAPIYFKPDEKELSTLKGQAKNIESIHLRGIYKVWLELDEDLGKQEQAKVSAEVKRRLQANRNLCEVFQDPKPIGSQDFILCGEISLSPYASVEQVQARILFEVQSYLTPAVKAYSLQEMLDLGKTPEEIFEGPLYQDREQRFSGGFITNEDLEASELRSTIYLSDIIQRIMAIDGVEAVRDLVIQPNTAKLPANWDKWVVPVEAGCQAIIDSEQSRFVFYKDVLAFRANDELVQENLDELNLAARQERESIQISDLPMVQGEFVDPEHYESITTEFPLNYGIGEHGLSPRASKQEHAKAKQLKAYLLFYDQLMANFFAQLASVKQLFSNDSEIKQTYFSQLVSGMNGLEDLLADGEHFPEKLKEIGETKALFFERRHQFLDHLLSRFNEQFNEYVWLMYSMSGELDERQAMLEEKAHFLENYEWISRHRSAGFDYSLTDELWDTDNVSGLQHRVAHLLGFRNYRRRNLAYIQYDIYNEEDDDDLEEYRFRVIDSQTDKILISSSTRYLDEDDAIAEMKRCVELGTELASYELKETTDGRFYFNLIDETSEVIGRRIEYFDTPEERKEAIDYLRRFLKTNYSSEGFFVVEHILLRPLAAGYPVFRVCEGSENDCVQRDPYSFQVSVILPAWEKRFQNMDFRKFAEKTIRMETPAHIFPKICWVNELQLSEFEDCYKDWLLARSVYPKKASKYKEILDCLLRSLEKLNTVYPEGTLHDCVDGQVDNPMVLNLTSLGTMKKQKD